MRYGALQPLRKTPRVELKIFYANLKNGILDVAQLSEHAVVVIKVLVVEVAVVTSAIKVLVVLIVVAVVACMVEILVVAVVQVVVAVVVAVVACTTVEVLVVEVANLALIINEVAAAMATNVVFLIVEV
jgi:hypothetical protein